MAMGGCVVAHEMVIVGVDFVWLLGVVAVVDFKGPLVAIVVVAYPSLISFCRC